MRGNKWSWYRWLIRCVSTPRAWILTTNINCLLIRKTKKWHSAVDPTEMLDLICSSAETWNLFISRCQPFVERAKKNDFFFTGKRNFWRVYSQFQLNDKSELFHKRFILRQLFRLVLDHFDYFSSKCLHLIDRIIFRLIKIQSALYRIQILLNCHLDYLFRVWTEIKTPISPVVKNFPV